MKRVLLGCAFIAVGTLAAMSQERRMEERKVEERPNVTIPLPIPQVGVGRRERVETEGRGGCETKSVTKERPGEEKTVTRSNCGGS
jgi:hypothetical protein